MPGAIAYNDYSWAVKRIVNVFSDLIYSLSTKLSNMALYILYSIDSNSQQSLFYFFRYQVEDIIRRLNMWTKAFVRNKISSQNRKYNCCEWWYIHN